MSYERELERSVTLKDVAERAGVSAMAVSTVLRDKSGNVRVSKDTRERILQAAHELRYHPHGVARALRRRRTDIVGFYSGFGYVDARKPFDSVVIGGLQEGCDLRRKHLLLYGAPTGFSPDQIFSSLAEGWLDGLVVNAAADDPLVDLLRDSSLPIVAIVNRIPGIPSVVADEAQGSRLIVDRLAERGHRRVVYCFDPVRMSELDSAHRRMSAFVEQCGARGIEVEYWPLDDAAGGSDDFLACWKRRAREERATAVACWHDLSAYKVLQWCEEQSIAVPDDLALAGYDGFPEAVAPRVKLTTVCAPWAGVARTAVGLLEEITARMPVSEEVVLPVEFVSGNSA